MQTPGLYEKRTCKASFTAGGGGRSACYTAGNLLRPMARKEQNRTLGGVSNVPYTALVHKHSIVPIAKPKVQRTTLFSKVTE